MFEQIIDFLVRFETEAHHPTHGSITPIDQGTKQYYQP
jgi:hypothetical protein